jgi:long-chain fatty acid transport protein
LCVILFAISKFTFAGGFQINEHSARAMGMAGAFTGLANDASAVYFNPAGITQLSGTNFLAGVT